jgi:hypothetical protein
VATLSPSGSAGAIVEITNSAVSPANQFSVVAVAVLPGERASYAFPDGCTNITWRVRQIGTEVRFFSDVNSSGYYTTATYNSGGVNTKGVTFCWETDTDCIVEVAYWGPKGKLEYDAIGKFASELFTLTALDIEAKKLKLTLTPNLSYNVSVTPKEGCPQFIGTDFQVNGKEVVWNGMGLDGLLLPGDVVQVDYFY